MKVVALGEMVDFVGGGTPSKDESLFWGGDIPWVSVKDLKSKVINETIDTITPQGVEGSSTRVIEKGALIIATRMAVGKAVILGVDAAINQDLKAVRIKGELDRDYLFFFLKQAAPYFERVSTGATVKGIKLEHLRNLEIPLPPLEEQKRIAGILDEADRVRKKTQALIDKYDELAQSLFLDMFGDPVTNPKGWEQFLLSEHCIVVTKGTTPTSLNEDFTSSGVPFLRAQNVVNGRVDLEDVLFVSQDTHDGILKRSQIHSGDVLFTIAGSLGRTGIVPATDTGLNCNQAVAIIRPMKESMNPFFLNGLLSSEAFNRNLLSNKVTATISNLSLGQIKQAVVPIPPQSEQKRFEESIKSIEAERERAEKQVRDCNSLFNALLQKAFKGELT